MRTREQIISHLKCWGAEAPSETGLRVAELLERWQGLHHMESSAMKKVNWSNTLYQTVVLSSIGTPGGALATFDFDDLTRLVFLAHDLCIRVSIEPCNPKHLRLMFHPRRERDGGMSIRHPTIETALERWRENNPAAAPHRGRVTPGGRRKGRAG